jgi:2-keto-4-pentenoate hydratase/2-oxohepta-3-ene-1,7-dioic acid hydratase in catechol pathway
VKLLTYDRRGHRRLGALTGGRVVDLPDAVGHPAFPTTLEALIAHHGGSILEIARESLVREDVLEFAVPDPRLLPPILPASIRVFRSFGEPAGGSRSPMYSRREHRAILGPGEDLPWPPFAAELDFEVQAGCLIGGWGRDLTPSQARRRIFGYVLVNDWVARDVERDEREAAQGSGKSRDFATSVGPCVVTADELDPAGVELSVRVDGETWGKGGLAGMRWAFPELVAHASRGEDLWPGDLLCSGPFAGGSGADVGRCPPPGSLVEVEGTGVGTLETRIGRRPRRFSSPS